MGSVSALFPWGMLMGVQVILILLGWTTTFDHPTSSPSVAISPRVHSLEARILQGSPMDDMERRRRYSEELYRNGSGIVYFMHLHKCAGSTICDMAQLNSVRVAPHRNCRPTNISEYDPESTSDPREFAFIPFHKWSPDTQARWARQEQRNFIANEMELTEVSAGGDFLYITGVRDPLDRMVSAYKHGMEVMPPSTPGEIKKFSLWQWCEATLWAPCDNFLTRTLAGVHFHKRGTVTEEHLAIAMERLNHFSVVVVVEMMEQSTRLLQLTLGWTRVDPRNVRSGTQKNSRARNEEGISSEDIAWLSTRNSLDLRLYAYAVQLHMAQLRRAEALYASRLRPESSPWAKPIELPANTIDYLRP